MARAGLDERLWDRDAIGDVIQRVPSDRYTFSMWPAIDDGRGPRRCLIGDVVGSEVLTTIESGRMCLYLHDVGAILRDRLGLALADRDEAGRALRHGLVIASRDHGLAIAARLGAGAIEVVAGRLQVIDGGEIREIAAGGRFAWTDARTRHFVAVDGPATALVQLSRGDEARPGPIERLSRTLDRLLCQPRDPGDRRPIDYRLVRRALAMPR